MGERGGGGVDEGGEKIRLTTSDQITKSYLRVRIK